MEQEVLTPEQAGRKALDALCRYNSRDYAYFCNLSGIKPEDEDLYSLGLSELVKEEAFESRLEVLAEKQPALKKPRNQMTRHELFIERAESLINADPFSNRETTLELLRHYAPGQFGLNGARNISEYSGPKLYGLLRGVLRTARKKAELGKP